MIDVNSFLHLQQMSVQLSAACIVLGAAAVAPNIHLKKQQHSVCGMFRTFDMMPDASSNERIMPVETSAKQLGG